MKKIIIVLALCLVTSVTWGEQFSETDIKHTSIGDVIYRSIKTTFPSSIIEQYIQEYLYLGCDNKCVMVSYRIKLTKTETNRGGGEKVRNISDEIYYLPLTSDRKAYLPISSFKNKKYYTRNLVLTVDKEGAIDIDDPHKR